LAEFVQPRQVAVNIILAATRADAEAALLQIEEGTPFQDVAREVSLHPSRTLGGKLEPFSRGTYDSELEDKAFQMKPGQMELLPTDRGVFVIQKTGEIAEVRRSFEEVRDSLVAEIAERKEREALQVFLREIRQGQSVSSPSPATP
jgi:parvulin-like peptidyl-prolyl isomerase